MADQQTSKHHKDDLEKVEEEYEDQPVAGNEGNGPEHGSTGTGRGTAHKSSKHSKGGNSAGSSTGGTKG
jgi:hypothetical protein